MIVTIVSHDKPDDEFSWRYMDVHAVGIGHKDKLLVLVGHTPEEGYHINAQSTEWDTLIIERTDEPNGCLDPSCSCKKDKKI